MLDLRTTREGDQVWTLEGGERVRGLVVKVDRPGNRVCLTLRSGWGPRVTRWCWAQDCWPDPSG